MNITSSCENGILVVGLEGRLDSSNAPQIGPELDDIFAKNAHTASIIDADKLEYISSAGLRVILRLRKGDATLKIVNASVEVYDIFEMTGFNEMMPVEKAYRRLSVDGCPVIGKGAKGTVYRYNGDTVIKVYNDKGSLPDIINERKLARRAFVLGIPTAISYDIVRVGESYGSVFELLDAQSYSKLIISDPEHIDDYIAEYAANLRTIHSTVVNGEDIPDIKTTLDEGLERVRKCLDDDAFNKLKKLVYGVPDRNTMLHNDYHTNNVMRQNGEIMLIDMDRLAYGHPIFELGNIHITYVVFGEVDPKMTEDFLGLPYETAKYFWKKFLACYLGTDDEKRIAEVERKVSVLTYFRLIRHNVKRGEAGKAAVEYGKSKLLPLLETVDTLDF